MLSASRIGSRFLRDRRGVSTVEYALLLIAMLLVVAGAYRLLGRGDTKTAQTTTHVLQGSDESLQSGNGGANGNGPNTIALAAQAQAPKHKHKGGGFWHGVASFTGKFVKGAILGDWSHGDGWPGIIGQSIVGAIPIVGDIADVRDIGAAIKDVATGKPGGWPELLSDIPAAIPVVGGPIKGVIKGARHIAEEGAVKGGEKALAKDGEKAAEKGAAKDGKDASKEDARAARKAEQVEKLRDQTLDGAIQKARSDGKYDKLSAEDKAFVDESQENARLAIDPDGDGGFKVGEARAAQRAESSGQLDGPVRRATSGADPRESGADLIDGKGQLWDVKDARAGADNIAKLANRQENILVDCKNLTDAQYEQLVADTKGQLAANAGGVKFVR